MRTFLLIALIAVCGCGQPESKELAPPQADVIISDVAGGRGYYVAVFEYESHKYLMTYHGGMLHAESCACKSK